MAEIWKNIKGFENYKVSNYGRIKNKDNKILKPQKNTYNYMSIVIYKRQKYSKTIPKNFRIHRLVLETFKPVKNMENLQVNHIDHNRANNNLNNLEWTTAKENCNRKKQKNIFYNSKGCYDESGNFFNSYREAGRFYNISPNTVKRDCLGLTKKIENNYKQRTKKRMTFHN